MAGEFDGGHDGGLFPQPVSGVDNASRPVPEDVEPFTCRREDKSSVADSRRKRYPNAHAQCPSIDYCDNVPSTSYERKDRPTISTDREAPS